FTKPTMIVVMGDFDGDGDVDFVEGRKRDDGWGAPNRHFTSNQSLTDPNDRPSAPSSDFNVTLGTTGHGSGSVTLTWGSGADTETSLKLLQYQPRVGTGTAANNIVSGVTASPNYVTRLMPNGQSKRMVLNRIPCDDTYYWSVAAVDTGLRQSAWSTEQSFTLDASCVLTIDTPAPPAAPAPEGGGGLPWNILHQNAVPEEPLPPPEGTVTVSVFRDSNGDGKKSRKEVVTGFEGLTVTVTGNDGSGSGEMVRNGTVGADGTVKIGVPPSGTDGYAVTADEGSTALAGLELSTPAVTGVMVESKSDTAVTMGFRPRKLLGHRPCLTIGEEEGTGESESEKLLSLLEDSFGKKAADGVVMDGALMSRRAFLTLLARTQCVPLLQTPADLVAALVKAGKGGVTLKDLPLVPLSADAVTVYSLLGIGLPVTRETSLGSYADLKSPITRGEAVLLAGAALGTTETALESGSVLPTDLRESSRYAQPYRTLMRFTALPRSFRGTFGATLGMTQEEGMTLLLRTAFSAGKIGVVPVSYDTAPAEETQETFMTLLPEIPARSCLTEDTKREADVMFVDLSPGSRLFADATHLLKFGTVNGDGKTLWLLTGTEGTTEYGVRTGEARLGPEKPVTIAELLRTLEVLRCRPPATAKAVATELLAGETNRGAGSGDRRAARDALTGMTRGAGFLERILFASQDRETLYNLSLLTYAPEMLKGETRSPGAQVSVEEGSAILGSALLTIGLQEGVINAQEAENLATKLKAAIAEEIAPGSTEATRKQPLTRKMLVEFLATVVTGRVESSEETPTRVPIGEIWWERVR
ncbi:MAG: hypothetical protein PHO89_11750, partial [Methylacidiphilaceae bacterium]|nr:hypothetical protein [Candidatus Methylacidiphilaceae bacterium]